jgi:hypothetical protein
MSQKIEFEQTSENKVRIIGGEFQNAGEVIVNSSEYKMLKELKNVSITLPRIGVAKYKKEYFEASCQEGGLIKTNERFNKFNLHDSGRLEEIVIEKDGEILMIIPQKITTLAYNFYAEKTVSENGAFSVKDPAKMPLGRKVLAKVQIIQKTDGRTKQKSLIVNCFVYEVQDIMKCEYAMYEENKADKDGLSFKVPKDKIFINFVKVGEKK